MACVDENALVEYAEGFLPEGEAAGIAEHIAGCDSCLEALSGLARASWAEDSAPSVPSPIAREQAVATPAEILRETLREKAPMREQISLTFDAIVTAVAAGSIFTSKALGHPYVPGLGPLLCVAAVYFVGVLALVRLGSFHPVLPWMNACVEVTVTVTAALFIGRHFGPVAGVDSAGEILLGGFIVYSALRSSRYLSLALGVLASIECWLVFLHFRPDLPEPLQRDLASAQVTRTVFLLLCGVGGAFVATLFQRNAEEALRSAREQDLMGKYLLRERLGEGGMAEVFRATYCPEGGFARTVAVKRVLPRFASDPEFVEMFREEARLGAMLAHPNIVQVLDCGRFRDTFILAMEFVEGTSLYRMLEEGPLEPAMTAYVGAELAKALEYIHQRQGPTGKWLRLVHRDLNPPNVLLSQVGEVKLGDFGVAFATVRQVVGDSDRFYGKLDYAAPEQLAEMPLDARCDLYALGLTLHESLTGRAPERGQPSGPLPSSVPPQLAEIIDRLLVQDRERRTQSATEVLDSLLALPAKYAPYPTGQRLLTHALKHAAAKREAAVRVAAKETSVKRTA